MLYMANNYTTPTQFLALILEDGQLNLLILDRSRNLTQIQSNFMSYDNGMWHTVSARTWWMDSEQTFHLDPIIHAVVTPLRTSVP